MNKGVEKIIIEWNWYSNEGSMNDETNTLLSELKCGLTILNYQNKDSYMNKGVKKIIIEWNGYSNEGSMNDETNT